MTCKLHPCPCGKTPTMVIVNSGRVKWAYVCGNCCNGWWREFRADYATGEVLVAKAAKAWNEASRGERKCTGPNT